MKISFVSWIWTRISPAVGTTKYSYLYFCNCCTNMWTKLSAWTPLRRGKVKRGQQETAKQSFARQNLVKIAGELCRASSFSDIFFWRRSGMPQCPMMKQYSSLVNSFNHALEQSINMWNTLCELMLSLLSILFYIRNSYSITGRPTWVVVVHLIKNTFEFSQPYFLFLGGICRWN